MHGVQHSDGADGSVLAMPSYYATPITCTMILFSCIDFGGRQIQIRGVFIGPVTQSRAWLETGALLHPSFGQPVAPVRWPAPLFHRSLLTDTEQAQATVRDAVLKLGEHFESVRVFVTRANPERPSDTQAIDEGTGNFYAQLGQIKEWVAIQDQYQRNWANRNDAKLNTPED